MEVQRIRCKARRFGRGAIGGVCTVDKQDLSKIVSRGL